MLTTCRVHGKQDGNSGYKFNASSLPLGIEVYVDTKGIESMCENQNIIGPKHDLKFHFNSKSGRVKIGVFVRHHACHGFNTFPVFFWEINFWRRQCIFA